MNSLVERLGWMLLHSVWQGAAGWIALQFALAFLRRHSARVRYLAGCSALMFVTVAPWITFFCLDVGRRLETPALSPANSAPAAASLSPTVYPSASFELGPATRSFPPAPSALGWQIQDRLHQWLPWLVRLWALGCCVGLIRLARRWHSTQRLMADDGTPATEALGRIFDRVCRRLGLARAVALKMSHRIDVPAVVG